MRHGESQNNILGKISKEIYTSHRTSEPELSARGVADCCQAGQRLSEMGIKFDFMLTSAHKRAVLSLKHVRENLADAQSIPCYIMTQIHEEHGVNMAGQIYPGLSRTEILELLPELQIPADQEEIVTEEGWCRLPHIESEEELNARVKVAL